jgi:hypothetical protein
MTQLCQKPRSFIDTILKSNWETTGIKCFINWQFLEYKDEQILNGL